MCVLFCFVFDCCCVVSLLCVCCLFYVFVLAVLCLFVVACLFVFFVGVSSRAYCALVVAFCVYSCSCLNDVYFGCVCVVCVYLLFVMCCLFGFVSVLYVVRC